MLCVMCVIEWMMMLDDVDVFDVVVCDVFVWMNDVCVMVKVVDVLCVLDVLKCDVWVWVVCLCVYLCMMLSEMKFWCL